MVEQLFLAMPGGCLQFGIVVFPDHFHLLFLLVAHTTLLEISCRRSYTLFGLTNVYLLFKMIWLKLVCKINKTELVSSYKHAEWIEEI